MEGRSTISPNDSARHPGLCASCQTPLRGKFCHQCGEKRITVHDYSLAHFFENVLESFSHFDFRFFRSLRILLFRPGQLTRDWLAGRRKGQVGPVQLFLVLNLLFVVWVHLGHAMPFNTPLRVQRSNPPAAEFKQQQSDRAIAASGLTAAEFEKEFDHTADLLAKTWVFAFIPAFALVLAAVYGFRRYFYEMLVFSSHTWGFLLVWLPASLFVWGLINHWILRRVFGLQLQYAESETFSALLVLAGFGTYLFRALRNAFGSAWWTALPASFAMLVATALLVAWYRFMLFFLTLWFM